MKMFLSHAKDGGIVTIDAPWLSIPQHWIIRNTEAPSKLQNEEICFYINGGFDGSR